MPPPQRLVLEGEHRITAELAWRLTCVSDAVVTRVGSGAEAIERAPELCPARALADIGLPGGMAGLEASALKVLSVGYTAGHAGACRVKGSIVGTSVIVI